MHAEEGRRLRELWNKKGNPPCEHLHLDKEYFGGMEGDKICMTCGETFTDTEVEELHNNRKNKN